LLQVRQESAGDAGIHLKPKRETDTIPLVDACRRKRDRTDSSRNCRSPRHALVASWFAGLLALVATGCSGPKLMPTPNVYREAEEDPFARVPAEWQTNDVDLLYVTDRVLERRPGRRPAYTAGRAPQLAYGSCRVSIGQGIDWPTLVRESRSAKRDRPLPLRVTWVEEQGRFPAPPVPLEATPLGLRPPPQAIYRQRAAAEGFQREIERRLAATPRKEAYVFVHGFNNDFDWAAVIAAEVWHFLPREGLPIVYTWPAGRGGLRGYTYDRESGEFTVFHLKQMLRALAACPSVEKIHLLAHSRGSDVATSAVRELLIEAHGQQPPTGPVFKLENLVLIAPDLDFEVVGQRIAAEWVPLAVRRFTVYVCEKDRAIRLANWLFEGIRRLGQLRTRDLAEEQRVGLRRTASVQFVDARVKVGFLGHGYFHDNPAVSSDLIMLLRENCDAGSEFRPLARDEDLFWRISDDYLSSGMR
jgi:esterase/lipase superfamily enzyme